MASKQKKPRKANGYKMPAPIPAGFVVKNKVQKQSWSVGTSVGKGGFGEIYCCSSVDGEGDSKSKKNVFPYVMKIEPQENGPLFVEMHFYMKVAKKDDIENWKKSRGMKCLGMPCFLGSGSFEFSNERYRYIVMDRYGKDIWSIFLENNKIFPCATALRIGLQILDVLEYIHGQGYAHCDVKGANLLLGIQKGFENQVYLVDFGLAARCAPGPFKPDPKKAHNGTIEYTSRDAHAGVVTLRGDMEILGFNLLHWITSKLPWDDVTDPKVAEEQKKALMTDVPSSIKKLIPTAPPVMTKYLDYVSKMKHDETPDYNLCRKLFQGELKALGATNDGKLLFRPEKPEKMARKAPAKSSGRAKIANGNASPGKSLRKAKTVHENASTEEEDDEPVLPPTPKRTRVKANEKEKQSWKDCPSAIASNVGRAGEYVSVNPKPVKRKRKQ